MARAQVTRRRDDIFTRQFGFKIKKCISVLRANPKCVLFNLSLFVIPPTAFGWKRIRTFE